MPAPQVWLRSAIEEAAGCDAYPLDAQEGAAPPYVVYRRTATNREIILSGDETLSAAITVEVYRDDYVAVWETADAVVGAIHGFAGEHEGTTINSCRVTNQADGDPVFLEGQNVPTYVVEIDVEIGYEP